MVPIHLAKVQSLSGQQFSSHANRCCSSENEVESVSLIHASSSDQRYLWQWHFKGTQVLDAAHMTSGEYLYKVRASFPCRDDFCRGQRSWKRHHVGFPGVCNPLRNKPRARRESSSCLYASLRGFLVEHGAGTHGEIREALC